MKLQPKIDLSPIVAALQPCERTHLTEHGERTGFLMSDATRALGGLAAASEAIAALMLAELLDSSPLLIGGEDPTTLYRLIAQQPPRTATH